MLFAPESTARRPRRQLLNIMRHGSAEGDEDIRKPRATPVSLVAALPTPWNPTHSQSSISDNGPQGDGIPPRSRVAFLDRVRPEDPRFQRVSGPCCLEARR